MATYTSPQDGTTLDTRISQNAATTNFSTGTEVYIGESDVAAALSRGLYQFPGLSNGTIPPSSIVTSASIFIKVKEDRSSNARTLSAYRSKRDVVISQATWNIWKTGSNWATAGGFHADDCEQTSIGDVSVGASVAPGTWIEIPLNANAILAIVNGTWTTPTFLLKVDTENADQYLYYASDTVTSTDRPYIVVNYIPAGGVPIFFD